jgi:hypothetical protein
MMGPAYHPEWLVTFWLSIPVLNALNPHYLLIIIAAVIGSSYFLRKKRSSNEELPEKEEQMFKHLLLRKNVIEEQLVGLEAKLKAAEINAEDYEKLFKDYQRHLNLVKKELQQYTL